MLHIIGLGYGEKDMTLEAAQNIEKAKKVIVKTEKYKGFRYFTRREIAVTTFDELYCSITDYDELNSAIAKNVVQYCTAEKGDVCYCVGGSATSDKSVEALIPLLKKASIPYDICGGMSYGERAIVKTIGYSSESLTISATDYLLRASFNPMRQSALLITEVYDRYIASEVKLKLMKIYGDEIDVFVVTGEKIIPTKLCDLDQIVHFTYDSTIVLPPMELEKKERYSFNDLLDILYILRAPDGCQWDKMQTHKSIRKNVIEEAYELVEAIDRDDIAMMTEESGDVILQGVFHAAIGESSGEFDYNDILTTLCKKLIFRHTHIFGENKANNPDEALAFWEKAKSVEKKHGSYTEKMDGIATTLPELTKGYKILKVAKKCGFDWNDIEGIYAKIAEELDEVRGATGDEIEAECGDLLLAVINLAIRLDIDPELALARANRKFRNRFSVMEELAAERGKTLEKYTIDEQEELWKKAKKSYK